MNEQLCEQCMYYAYDEEEDDFCCTMELDEDDMMRLRSSQYKQCPCFRFGDDYTIVKKQN